MVNVSMNSSDVYIVVLKCPVLHSYGSYSSHGSVCVSGAFFWLFDKFIVLISARSIPVSLSGFRSADTFLLISCTRDQSSFGNSAINLLEISIVAY